MNKHEAEHLLEHWIEHNESHSRSFRERAEQVREVSPSAAQAILEAAELMDQSNQKLKEAKEAL
jgi:hypothetical protein